MYRGERFNSISHLVGAIAGLIGLVVLVVDAARDRDLMKIVSFSVYGSSLLLLYTISTIYHSTRGPRKKVFRILDYHAIYLLIAGTYTPFSLVTLGGAWGWTLFGMVWGLALVGVVLELLPRRGPRVLPIIIYLVMGWLALVALFPLLEALGQKGFTWLLIGGLFYTFGIYFYLHDEKVPHFHGIWHLFVLAGSTSHFFTVYHFVA